MCYHEIIGEEAGRQGSGLDDLFEMANLPKQDTGIDGIVYVSTAEASHGPRVKWFPGRPGRAAPCLSVSIADEPEARNLKLPPLVEERAAPLVIEWVRLNKAALLEFWTNGISWTRQEVAAHLDGLKKVGSP